MVPSLITTVIAKFRVNFHDWGVCPFFRACERWSHVVFHLLRLTYFEKDISDNETLLGCHRKAKIKSNLRLNGNHVVKTEVQQATVNKYISLKVS